ncbi:hypothetical protein [Saccharothrix variisporea]|uniref:Asp23/Gls24 family envelope stress response protein n=1 Tax=Saccharothrix variisporea TaxID=543527 RepID=A0A495X9Q8_9PSEU|nr:hypothetical protein [Saccharothrix variisporea]RKT69594.1 hypothetical protein DFJ66_2828 [Saccharothrix variisporea]
MEPAEHVEPAERVEAALLAHPSVARLHGGFASYLPGRRVDGVRLTDRTAVSVVLRAGRPIPEVVEELRAAVREVAGPAPVDITVADLEDL